METSNQIFNMYFLDENTNQKYENLGNKQIKGATKGFLVAKQQLSYNLLYVNDEGYTYLLSDESIPKSKNENILVINQSVDDLYTYFNFNYDNSYLLENTYGLGFNSENYDSHIYTNYIVSLEKNISELTERNKQLSNEIASLRKTINSIPTEKSSYYPVNYNVDIYYTGKFFNKKNDEIATEFNKYIFAYNSNNLEDGNNSNNYIITLSTINPNISVNDYIKEKSNIFKNYFALSNNDNSYINVDISHSYYCTENISSLVKIDSISEDNFSYTIENFEIDNPEGILHTRYNSNYNMALKYNDNTSYYNIELFNNFATHYYSYDEKYITYNYYEYNNINSYTYNPIYYGPQYYNDKNELTHNNSIELCYTDSQKEIKLYGIYGYYTKTIEDISYYNGIIDLENLIDKTTKSGDTSYISNPFTFNDKEGCLSLNNIKDYINSEYLYHTDFIIIPYPKIENLSDYNNNDVTGFNNILNSLSNSICNISKLNILASVNNTDINFNQAITDFGFLKFDLQPVDMFKFIIKTIDYNDKYTSNTKSIENLIIKKDYKEYYLQTSTTSSSTSTTSTTATPSTTVKPNIPVEEAYYTFRIQLNGIKIDNVESTVNNEIVEETYHEDNYYIVKTKKIQKNKDYEKIIILGHLENGYEFLNGSSNNILKISDVDEHISHIGVTQSEGNYFKNLTIETSVKDEEVKCFVSSLKTYDVYTIQNNGYNGLISLYIINNDYTESEVIYNKSNTYTFEDKKEIKLHYVLNSSQLDVNTISFMCNNCNVINHDIDNQIITINNSRSNKVINNNDALYKCTFGFNGGYTTTTTSTSSTTTTTIIPRQIRCDVCGTIYNGMEYARCPRCGSTTHIPTTTTTATNMPYTTTTTRIHTTTTSDLPTTTTPTTTATSLPDTTTTPTTTATGMPYTTITPTTSVTGLPNTTTPTTTWTHTTPTPTTTRFNTTTTSDLPTTTPTTSATGLPNTTTPTTTSSKR